MKTKMMVAFVCINFLHIGSGAMVHALQAAKLKQTLAKPVNKEDLTELLFFAAERNHTGDIEELFSGTIIPDITARNKAGHKLLDLVMFWGNAEIIPFLVAREIDVNEIAPNGRPPIIEALFGLRPKKVLIQLIVAGAQLNVKDKQGMTALMWAARNNPTCVPVLIGAGADLAITNEYDNNKCAREYAQDKTFFDSIVERSYTQKVAEAHTKMSAEEPEEDPEDYEVVR